MASGNKHKVDDAEAMAIRPSDRFNLFGVNLALRMLVLVTMVASLAATVTSNQTKVFEESDFASERLVLTAKFTYSSAIIYYVVALSFGCLYGIITGIASLFTISVSSPSTMLLLLLAIFDAMMATVVASGTGAVASIAYIALKGNDHIGWTKVCDVFDKFCRHAGSAIAISLAGSIILLLLVAISTYSLYRRTH